MYGHTYSKRMDQPGKVASPARGQLNRENECFLPRFLPSSTAAASIYFVKGAIRHRVNPEFLGSRNCVPMAFTAESSPAQGQ